MSLVPDTTQGKLTFFQARAAVWVARADEIGATPAAAAAVADRLAAAQAKYKAAYAARQAARTATAELKAAVRDLMRSGADVVKQVRAKAATAGGDGDGIYALALIPPPAAPSRIPAPGKPTDFTATLLADGSLKLRWKCPNPANAVGTVYQVSRRIGDAGTFTTVGIVGKRTFLDTTVPAGTASVTYEVVAVRSTRTGAAARFTVNFGVSGGRATVAASHQLAA